MNENNKALAVVESREDDGMSLVPTFAVTLEQASRQVKELQQFVRSLMVEGEDYGTIPGTQKPTLLKPGAEKLCNIYGLTPTVEVTSRHEDWDGPFFAYEVKVSLVSRRTGGVVAEGVGSCNSKERRYRNQDTYTIVNCVVPETRILTRDLRWVAAGELRTGDHLIAVEEQGTQYRRSLRDAEAIVYGRKLDDLYEIRLADGRTVRCNGEHKWLVKKVRLSGTEWAATSDIHKEIAERQGRPRHWQIMSICSPWTEENTKESGYMAGLLDADGTLSASGGKYQQVVVQFAQQSNGVLARMKAALEARAFAFEEVSCGSKISREPVFDLRLHGGLPEQMRFLGTIRPPRLLDRWCALVRLEGRRFEGDAVTIEAVGAIGSGEIVLLGSSAGTYIAEGLVAHNTILKMAKKRAFVDATLSATRASGLFTQDVEDAADEQPRPARPAAAPRSARKPSEPGPLYCADCRGEIVARQIGKTTYSPEDIAQRSHDKFKRQLCYDCADKASKAKVAHLAPEPPADVVEGEVVEAETEF